MRAAQGQTAVAGAAGATAPPPRKGALEAMFARAEAKAEGPRPALAPVPPPPPNAAAAEWNKVWEDEGPAQGGGAAAGVAKRPRGEDDDEDWGEGDL